MTMKSVLIDFYLREANRRTYVKQEIGGLVFYNERRIDTGMSQFS